ncbi:PASTA domain-containing protein [Streptosporangium sp. NPDC020145]|uniref:PASTA domain-containing protein n=1 Tax=Streptosporangium jomthongense TaxID=1193683 RepID=A0ABV8FAS4_9ACTN
MADFVVVPDFCGSQALNAWLAGHDAGVLLQGPDPDSPQPVMDGVVVAQKPPPGSRIERWGAVTVWTRHDPGEGGVREPRRPSAPLGTPAAEPPGEDQAATRAP